MSPIYRRHIPASSRGDEKPLVTTKYATTCTFTVVWVGAGKDGTVRSKVPDTSGYSNLSKVDKKIGLYPNVGKRTLRGHTINCLLSKDNYIYKGWIREKKVHIGEVSPMSPNHGLQPPWNTRFQTMENLRRGNEKHYKKCPYKPEIKRGHIRSKTWASFTLNLPTFFYRKSEAKNLENWTTDIIFAKYVVRIETRQLLPIIFHKQQNNFKGAKQQVYGLKKSFIKLKLLPVAAMKNCATGIAVLFDLRVHTLLFGREEGVLCWKLVVSF